MKRFYLLIVIYSFGFFAAFHIQDATAQMHFKTVWQGENGQNHMNFVVVSAVLENLSLEAEDEIAVFSGHLCVGAKKITKSINLSDTSTFLNIPASQNDGSNNGFASNDTVIFKIWDSQNQKELPAKAVLYRNDVPTWITSGKFAPEATAVVEILTSSTEYFSTSSFSNGSGLMNINLLGISNSGLSAGDEVAAFDGQVCVGTLKISEGLMATDSASIIATSSSSDNIPDGFTDGNTIQIKAWNHLTGEVSAVEGEVVAGQMVYEKNANVLLELKSVSTLAKSIENSVNMDVFPNPCIGRFTARLSQFPETSGKIEILDISGRTVASRMLSALSEEFNLEQQSAGIYLVKSTFGTNIMTQKLIITR